MWQNSNKNCLKSDKKLTKNKKVFKMWQKPIQKCVKKTDRKIFSCYIFVTFVFQERPLVNHQRPTKAANNSENVTKMWQKQQQPTSL